MSMLQMLLGALATIIQLPPSINVTETTLGTAQGGLRIDNTGDLTQLLFSTSPDLGSDWIIPKVGMSSYEVRMTPTSGTLTTGTINTFQDLGTSRSYTVTATSVSSKTFVGTLEIRAIGTAVILASCPVTLVADAI